MDVDGQSALRGVAHYQLFAQFGDGRTMFVMDAKRGSISSLGVKLSRRLRFPVIAVVDYGDGRKPERFRYEKGTLVARLDGNI